LKFNNEQEKSEKVCSRSQELPYETNEPNQTTASSSFALLSYLCRLTKVIISQAAAQLQQ